MPASPIGRASSRRLPQSSSSSCCRGSLTRRLRCRLAASSRAARHLPRHDARERQRTHRAGDRERGLRRVLIVTVMPTLRLGFDGDLIFRLIKVSAGGVGGWIDARLPFSFEIDTHIGTRHLLDDYLPRPGNLPRSWGENPPASIIDDPVEQPPVPDTFDFITPAESIEEAVVPTGPAGAPVPTGTSAPHHAPWGLVYEVRTYCDGSHAPIYDGSTTLPSGLATSSLPRRSITPRTRRPRFSSASASFSGESTSSFA